jgi:hypothetical protein
MPEGHRIDIDDAEAIRAEFRRRDRELRDLLAEPLAMLESGGRKSRHAKGHPLLRMLDELGAWVERPDFANADYERSAIETAALLNILQARGEDSALPEHIRSMVEGKQFRHEQAVLGIAYQLEMDGLRRAALVRPAPGDSGKNPDLWILGKDGPDPLFQIEVKAPPSLRTNGGRLRKKVADRAVQHAMSAGRVRPAGQFYPGIPGVVALAAYEVPDGDFSLLTRAAEEEFQSRVDLDPVLASMMFVNFVRLEKATPRVVDPSEAAKGITRLHVRLTWSSHHELVMSSAYVGVQPLSLVTGRRPPVDVMNFAKVEGKNEKLV